MKSKLILSGLLLTVPAMAWAAELFTSPTGYQIQPAKSWRTNNSGAMKSDVFFFAPKTGGYSANLIVKTLPIAENETLKADKGIGDEIFPRMFKDFHLVSQEMKPLDGAPALWTVATYHIVQPSVTLRMRRVEAIKDGTVYWFTANELDTNHAKTDQAITDMLSSIKWTTKTGAAALGGVSL